VNNSSHRVLVFSVVSAASRARSHCAVNRIQISEKRTSARRISSRIIGLKINNGCAA
jgi:hypothetical protein